MTIVWVSHSQKLGGAERSLCEAVGALVEKGHEVWVVIPSNGEIEQELNRRGAKVKLIAFRWWVHSRASGLSMGLWCRKLLSHVRASYVLARFLCDLKPSVVLTNTSTTPVGALAAKLCKTPHVWYVREFGEKDHNLVFDFGRRISNVCMRALSDRVIGNSRCILKYLRGHIPEERLSLLYNAVEIAKTVDPVPLLGTFNVLIVGQIAEGKRQHDGIKALSILCSKGLDIYLTILGSEHDPAYSRLVRGLVRELKLAERVQILPFVSNPLCYIGSADIVLVCSSHEAFGRVTVEAMKMAKPVIGAESEGTAELITSGVTGILYESRNVEALAAAIERLYYDSQLRTKLGLNAKQWAMRECNRDVHVSRLLSILRQAMDSMN